MSCARRNEGSLAREQTGIATQMTKLQEKRKDTDQTVLVGSRAHKYCDSDAKVVEGRKPANSVRKRTDIVIYKIPELWKRIRKEGDELGHPCKRAAVPKPCPRNAHGVGVRHRI